MTEDGLEILNATSNCPYGKCDGSGLMHLVNKDKTEFARTCDCIVTRHYQRKIQSAKIPDEYKNVSVNSFDTNIYVNQRDKQKALYAKRVAIKYVEMFTDMKDKGKGLFLYSNTKGSGKTHLAISITNALIKMYDVESLYISSVNLLNEVKKTFQEKSENGTYELVNTFKRVPLLVIDDLGVENVTRWSEEMLTQILDERLGFKRPTIITSNFSFEELSREYPAGRVGSRIEKMTFPIPMPEESVRLLKAQQENEELARLFFK